MDTTQEKLTTRQRRFVEAFCGKSRFIAVNAAREAGYQGDYFTLAVVGSENLKKPNIKAAIKELLDTNAATPEECLARVTQRARGTAANLFKDVNGKKVFVVEAAFETGEIHNVKKVKEGKYGLEVELYDAQQADITLLGVYERLASLASDAESKDGEAEPAETEEPEPEEKPVIEIERFEDTTSVSSSEPAED